MSATQRQQLTPFIKYAHFFRVTLQSEYINNTLLNSSHPLVTAFKKGVLYPSFETQLNLQHVHFLISVIDSLDSLTFLLCRSLQTVFVIISLYQGCQIIEPNQVIDHIEVNAIPKDADGYDDNIHNLLGDIPCA
jgi:hypothetical protein